MESYDKSRLADLMAAAKKGFRMTDAEFAVQRANYARSEVGMGSDRDEAAYRAAVEAGDKATVRRLDQEAEDRVKRVFRE